MGRATFLVRNTRQVKHLAQFWVGTPPKSDSIFGRRQQGIDNSYISLMINLTTLAPDINDAILLNELPDHLRLFDLAVDPQSLWEDQRVRIIEKM